MQSLKQDFLVKVLDKAFWPCRKADPWICERHLHPRLRLLPQDLWPGRRVPWVCVQEYEPDLERDALLQLRRWHLAHPIGQALQAVWDWELIWQKGQNSQSPLHTGRIRFVVCPCMFYHSFLTLTWQMITFLVENEPSPEKEIWITASTMFRFPLFFQLRPGRSFTPTSSASTAHRLLPCKFSYAGTGASPAADSWRLAAPACSSAFPLPLPSTHRCNSTSARDLT